MAENTSEMNTVGRSPEQVYGRDAKSLLRASKGEAVGKEKEFWEEKGVVVQRSQENKKSLTPEPVSAFSPNTSPSINQETPNTPIRKPNILTRAFSKFISKLRW